jgi:type IV secretion system protein VirB8
VSSITFFERSSGVEDLAQVRFIKRERTGNGTEQLSHWIATVQYVYATPAIDPRMRRWNPLGFKIVDYRAEAEVLTPETGPAADGHATGQVP